jgi:heme exporter protein D
MSEALNKFVAMGGYAAYVWGSFGVFAAVLIWNLLTPRLARASVMKQLTEDEESGGERE